jgi:hypothetical protein
MMFLDCPAYQDDEGLRCGLPAVVKSRSAIRSTDGPLETAVIRCPSGHWFNAPIAFLTLRDPGTVAEPVGRRDLRGLGLGIG